MNRESDISPNGTIARHCFEIGDGPGGESLTLKSELIHNGEGEKPILNQELTLQSYCNSASFTLCGTPFTPSILRDLANQLEYFMNKHPIGE